MDDHNNGTENVQWMCSPMPLADFYAEHWEAKPLVIKRDNESYYDQLFSLQAMKKLVDSGQLHYENDVDLARFVADKRETLNEAGIAPPGVVWKRYTEDGCSVRLRCPQAYDDTVWKFLESLEHHWRCYVGCNVYLTPAGTQGFAPHYDDIEAFILQIEGKKHWRVYPPPTPADVLPRFSSPNYSAHDFSDADAAIDVILEPGDMLYFPRGWVHQGVSLPDSHSLHVTVSTALHHTYFDLVKATIDKSLTAIAAHESRWRKTLPWEAAELLGSAAKVHRADSKPMASSFTRRSVTGRPYERVQENVAALIDGLIASLDLDAGMDEITRKFIHERLPPPPKQATTASAAGTGPRAIEADDLGVDGRVKLARVNSCVLIVSEEEANMYFNTHNARRYKELPENKLTFDPANAPALQAVIDAFPESCRFGDLCDLLFAEEAEYAKEAGWEEGTTAESVMEDIQEGLRASIGALMDVDIFEAHVTET